MRPPHLDLNGLAAAFGDAKREKNEYLLDTMTGSVHFIPIAFFKQGEKGTLKPDTLQGQEREKAEIALQYLDDIEGRFELVPYVDPEAEADWKAEYQTEHGKSPDDLAEKMAWHTFRAEKIQEEIVTWIEETGMFEDIDEGSDSPE